MKCETRPLCDSPFVLLIYVEHPGITSIMRPIGDKLFRNGITSGREAGLDLGSDRGIPSVIRPDRDKRWWVEPM